MSFCASGFCSSSKDALGIDTSLGKQFISVYCCLTLRQSLDVVSNRLAILALIASACQPLHLASAAATALARLFRGYFREFSPNLPLTRVHCGSYWLWSLSIGHFPASLRRPRARCLRGGQNVPLGVHRHQRLRSLRCRECIRQRQ